MESIGRFQIVRELGRGAMGVVYHAIDPNIGRPVAIKTIRLGDLDNVEEREKLRERLFREARSAGILNHPNIVTIYDVEEEDGVAYIAMEFVNGPTLDQLMSAKEPLDCDRMFLVLRQAAAGLDYAHSKDIVHRDVKPGNIMLAEGGIVKVTDFGIAKATTSDQFTMTGAIVGTPNYMSPEQVQGLAVSGHSDQFSLAVIAFEMLTGEKPFPGEHLTTVVYKIVAEEPAPPARLNASLGARVDAVLRRALAKKPEERFETCTEFVDALDAACMDTPGWKAVARGGALSMPTIDTVHHAARPAVTLPPPRPRAAEAPSRSRALPVVLALLVAGGLIGLIAWQMQPQLRQQVQRETGAPAPAPQSKPEPFQPETPAPAEPKPQEQPPQEQTPPGQTPAEPANSEPKPSPMPPPENAEPRRPARSAAGPRQIAIITSPAGATAKLDGLAGATCITPCSLPALPGRHSLVLSLPGHRLEHREVMVGEDPVELPPVTLRREGGVLIVSSTPPGASIRINGERVAQLTPAQIPLATGHYDVTVEYKGVQQTTPVEIRNEATRTLRVTFE